MESEEYNMEGGTSVIQAASPREIEQQSLETKLQKDTTSTGYLFVHTMGLNLGIGMHGLLRWTQASMAKLAEAESRVLSKVGAYIKSRFIDVRLSNSSMYTVTVKPTKESEESRVPFVLVHGFAAGVAVWAANFDSLAGKRTVHAFDLLGFGRSSRPHFSRDATLSELEFVQSIEDWRKQMNIENMILIGHSFGGFLASSYTLEHPSRVRHLVLVDPWGFPEKPAVEQLRIPIWMRFLGSVLSKFNPLAALRAAGPFGIRLIKNLRSDLGVRYAFQDPEAIYEYIYQCNVQQPTGEVAFGMMTKSFGWAKRPMIHRFCAIDPGVPVTFICGSKSWIDSGSAYEIQSRRADSYVDVQIVHGAGHHVYADAVDSFNTLMRCISDMVDRGEDTATGTALATNLLNNGGAHECHGVEATASAPLENSDARNAPAALVVEGNGDALAKALNNVSG